MSKRTNLGGIKISSLEKEVNWRRKKIVKMQEIEELKGE